MHVNSPRRDFVQLREMLKRSVYVASCSSTAEDADAVSHKRMTTVTLPQHILKSHSHQVINAYRLAENVSSIKARATPLHILHCMPQ